MSQALCQVMQSQRQDMVSVHCTHPLFMSFKRKMKPETEAKAGQQKNIDTVRCSMQLYANKHANE